MATKIDIVGLDHGYSYTKDNLRNIFKSAYSRTNNTLTDKYKLTVDGEDYYFGSGIPTADTDKSGSMVNEISTLADLCLRGNKESYVVVGLPIAQYLTKKDKFANVIMQYNKLDVIYQNEIFKPNIKDVSVFAQGVGALFNIGLPDGTYISFDIGSYTINVVLVELIKGCPHIKKHDTWFDGIMTLFNKIITDVNLRYDLTLDIEFAESILTSGLTVYGEKQDLGFLKPIMKDYLENILSKFKPNYPYATTLIVLSGGGSNLLGNIFANCFPNSMLLPDAQFANAIGYYNFGLQKYGYLLDGRCINA